MLSMEGRNMNKHELDRLKAVCDYVVDSKACKNPLLNRKSCNAILNEWARDNTKPEEVRILCETVKQLCSWNKEEDTTKYQMLLDGVIVGVGTASDLEYEFAIDSKTIKKCATTKQLCHRRYVVNELCSG